MGHKTHPFSMRVSITKPWPTRWFFPSKGVKSSVGKYPFAKFLEEDEAIRRVIRKRVSQAGIAGIDIERTSTMLRIFLKTARPGLVIGQGGKGIEELSKALERELKKVRRGSAKGASLSVNVEELKRTEISAAYMAQQVAWNLEKRMPFRRMMKKQLDFMMQNKEVRGAKLTLAGRLDGAEIARRETLRRGPLPLQTLRADIDYGEATAFTTYGTIGIKVWIYKGEVFKKKAVEKD